MNPETGIMTTKPEQCCDEPRGFVGGVCDHCGGEVQSEFTNLELQQQVSDWRQKAYKLEQELAFRLEQNNVQQLQISELRKKLARTLKLQ
jgi:hypothetical protein